MCLHGLCLSVCEFSGKTKSLLFLGLRHYFSLCPRVLCFVTSFTKRLTINKQSYNTSACFPLNLREYFAFHP